MYIYVSDLIKCFELKCWFGCRGNKPWTINILASLSLFIWRNEVWMSSKYDSKLLFSSMLNNLGHVGPGVQLQRHVSRIFLKRFFVVLTIITYKGCSKYLNGKQNVKMDQQKEWTIACNKMKHKWNAKSHIPSEYLWICCCWATFPT